MFLISYHWWLEAFLGLTLSLLWTAFLSSFPPSQKLAPMVISHPFFFLSFFLLPTSILPLIAFPACFRGWSHLWYSGILHPQPQLLHQVATTAPEGTHGHFTVKWPTPCLCASRLLSSRKTNRCHRVSRLRLTPLLSFFGIVSSRTC